MEYNHCFIRLGRLRLLLPMILVAILIGIRWIFAASGPHYSVVDLGRSDSAYILRQQRDGNIVHIFIASKPYGEVGWIRAQGRNTSHSFLRRGGQFEDLGTLGGKRSYAWDLNAYGWVVGYSQLADQGHHAFLFHGSLMDDLGTLGGTNSQARGINDQGQIVGDADTPQGMRHAFLWEKFRMKDLGTLGGGLESVATSMNNKGDIVGYAMPLYADKHAVLWQQGTMYDLNEQILPDSGWELVEAVKIDDAGSIWGNGKLHGRWRRFMLRPLKKL